VVLTGAAYKPEINVNVLYWSVGSAPNPAEPAQRLGGEPLCKNIALGDSREPPASRFCCVSRVLAPLLRRGFATSKSGSPPGRGDAIAPG
jgi:hypothetical protein